MENRANPEDILEKKEQGNIFDNIPDPGIEVLNIPLPKDAKISSYFSLLEGGGYILSTDFVELEGGSILFYGVLRIRHGDRD